MAMDVPVPVTSKVGSKISLVVEGPRVVVSGGADTWLLDATDS